jgi:hypothetical protein
LSSKLCAVKEGNGLARRPLKNLTAPRHFSTFATTKFVSIPFISSYLTNFDIRRKTE